jgi:DNA-binding transcriptional MerR regulator
MDLTRDELVRRLRIDYGDLQEWMESDLLSSVDGSGNLFPESSLEEGELIKKFCSLGYALKEIQRIKRTVGLPLRDDKGKYVSKSEFLTIGELAERSGINVRTIKFWEEKNLIVPFRRTEGGFRLYKQDTVASLSFIKDLQAFNYTLSEIGNILRLVGTDPDREEEALAGMPLDELEKLDSGLSFLVERMREVREASLRVESVFSRRLRTVSRVLKARRR